MWKKISIITVSILIILMAITYFAVPQIVNSCLISFSEFNKIESNIYLDPDNMDDEKLILDSYAEAVNRVKELFGETKSEPVIIISKNRAKLKRFGMENTTGLTLKTLAGSFMIIGPDGMNTDIIAHELTHCELVKRMGLYNNSKLPSWFDEGLATQVDFRPKYSESVWNKLTDNGRNIKDFKLIETIEQFYDVSDEQMRILHYTISRHEIKRWLDIVGKEGILKLIEDIGNNNDFATTYKNMEERKRIN